jgi:inorganic phosphate transporter, PiT family
VQSPESFRLDPRREPGPVHLVGALLHWSRCHGCKSIIDPPLGQKGMAVIQAALVGAIAWNFTTCYFGLPTSSSKALMGGLVSLAIASASTIRWMTGVVGNVIMPMILSPLVGFVGGYLLMIISLWVLRKANLHWVERGFRIIVRSLR